MMNRIGWGVRLLTDLAAIKGLASEMISVKIL